MYIYMYYIRRAMSWAIGVEGTIGVDLRLEVPQCARVSGLLEKPVYDPTRSLMSHRIYI